MLTTVLTPNNTYPDNNCSITTDIAVDVAPVIMKNTNFLIFSIFISTFCSL